MTLFIILLATLTVGIGSVFLAAWLMHLGVGTVHEAHDHEQHAPQYLLSLAAGALLATAFMHLLPEAFESTGEAHPLFTTLLVSIVFFFLLDKAELWHHGHEHGHGHHTHNHGSAPTHAHAQLHAHPAPSNNLVGSWSLLFGDSLHCFGDGILIASAFTADMRLGFMAALAVLAHEIPHHIGDLAVLRKAGSARHVALMKVSLAGATTAIGGVLGYFLVQQLHDWLPFFLTITSSSFIYVALADLIPQLQRHLSTRQTVLQIVWLVGGAMLITLVSQLAHVHD